eukprot:2402055-Rhodomonas_salina.5
MPGAPRNQRQDNAFLRLLGQAFPVVHASCVFGLAERNDFAKVENVWKSTKSRIAAGDDFVLWSETALEIQSGAYIRLRVARSALRCDVRSWPSVSFSVICRRGCYAVSGTDIAYGISLCRVRY